MKRIYCILILSILFAGCRKDNPVRVPSADKPIALSAGIEWPDATKALINNVNGLANDGFVVWGSWVKDDADRALYSGDYASGSTNKVFGQRGTKVYYPTWTYSPQRFWYRGTYAFAAALPASAFNAEHVMRNDGAGSAGLNGAMDASGKLIMDFGTPGFDLKANQVDLMVAFDDVDNSDESRTGSDKVSLQFHHQLSQVTFVAKFESNAQADLQIDAVTIYGNSRTATRAEFTNGDNITGTWTTGTKTTSKTDNFKQASRPNANAWKNTETNVIENMLVFPETCTFTVVVDYTESRGGSSVSTSQSAEVSARWLAGKAYRYEFTLSSKTIVFGQPTVVPWSTPKPVDDIPSM